MKKIAVLLAFLAFAVLGRAQKNTDEDAQMVRKIYDIALTQGQAYPWLSHLCTQVGGRLSGSTNAAAAIAYTKNMLDTLGLDRVWLQPCMVTKWERGPKEEVSARGIRSGTALSLPCLALGNSEGSGPEGVTADIIEVHTLEELDALGTQVRGKIVFFNRPLDQTRINTGEAYGGAADQRVNGPARASKYGALGAIVRSLSSTLDDYPHTGVTIYDDQKPIPAIAISTLAADKLSQLIAKEPVRVYMRSECGMRGQVQSYNVIGEIRGSEKPDEIIIVGGHLDSWDPGQGAHDDGTGCAQSMDVLSIIKKTGYQPKRTIRCVLFMNEENGGGGGTAYADSSNAQHEYHMAAIESDGGGFTPRGFTFEGHKDVASTNYAKMIAYQDLLEPYGIHFARGGSGADIAPLRNQKGLLVGLKVDPQRYFDIHHTSADTFDKVNRRELELGAAAMTSLVCLLDKYGL